MATHSNGLLSWNTTTLPPVACCPLDWLVGDSSGHSLSCLVHVVFVSQCYEGICLARRVASAVRWVALVWLDRLVAGKVRRHSVTAPIPGTENLSPRIYGHF